MSVRETTNLGVLPERSEKADGHEEIYEAETFSPELTDALAKEYVGFWSKNTLRLLPILIIGFLSTSVYSNIMKSC